MLSLSLSQENEEYLVISLLLSRQGGMEGGHVFPSYGNWFKVRRERGREGEEGEIEGGMAGGREREKERRKERGEKEEEGRREGGSVSEREKGREREAKWGINGEREKRDRGEGKLLLLLLLCSQCVVHLIIL